MTNKKDVNDNLPIKELALSIQNTPAFDTQLIASLVESAKASQKFVDSLNQSLDPAIKAIQGVARTYQSLQKFHEQVITGYVNTARIFQSSINAINILQTGIYVNIEIFRQLNNIIITLPPNGSQKISTIDTDVLLNVDRIRTSNGRKDEYSLNTTTTATTNLGILQFKTTQQTNLIVMSLQQDMEEMKSFVYEDSKHKDEMLQELLDYYKNGGSSTVQIKEVIYNKKSSELTIDKNIIKIRADTRQQQLCNILLASKASAKKVWEVYDIVTLSGEYESTSEWNETFYNAVRHLNEKIQRIAHIEKFLLYDNKTVFVNPKYSSLFR